MGQKLMAASPLGRVGVVKKQPWLSGSERLYVVSFPLSKDARGHASDIMLIAPDVWRQNWSVYCVCIFHTGRNPWNLLRMDRNSRSPQVCEVEDKGQRSGPNLRWTWGVLPGRRNEKQKEKLFNACFLLPAEDTLLDLYWKEPGKEILSFFAIRAQNNNKKKYKKKKKSKKSCSLQMLYVDTVGFSLQCYLLLNPNGFSSRHLLDIMTFCAEVKVDGEKDPVSVEKTPGTAALHPIMLHNSGHSELLSPSETRVVLQPKMSSGSWLERCLMKCSISLELFFSS